MREPSPELDGHLALLAAILPMYVGWGSYQEQERVPPKF